MNDSVLVVVAHADDEVLGCGGSIARMTAEGRDVHILVMADGESSRVELSDSTNIDSLIKARQAAANKAAQILGCASPDFLKFPDNRMDSVDMLDVVKKVEESVDRLQPSTILTHHGGDLNIDHRAVHKAVITACRPLPQSCISEVLFFEVPSSTEWASPTDPCVFTPNCFIDISATLEKKLQALEIYENEVRAFPHPRSMQAVESLSRWRGASAGVKAAEAFMIGRKIVR